MRERQASNSAHPVPGRPSGNMGTGQAGHRIFGSRTSPAGSDAFGQAHCHRLRRSFGFGGVGQDRVSARELRTRQDPAFRRMDLSGGTEAPAEDPAGREIGASASKSPGQEAGRKFQIRRAANRQGSGPVGEPPGAPSGLRPGRTPEDCGARFRPGYRASKPPIANGRFGGRTQRDSGGRQRCRPPLLFGGLAHLVLRRRPERCVAQRHFLPTLRPSPEHVSGF